MNPTHPEKASAHAEPRRRPFLRWTGAAALLTLGDCLGLGAETPGPSPTAVLQRGDKIDLAEKPEDLLKRAYELGHQYEKKCGGCAQCTVAALQDALPFVVNDVDVFRAAACLDGGATPKGVQNCGSFTGLGMVIGVLCGRTRKEKDAFTGDRKLSHELIRKVYKRFEERYGSVLCKDVKEKAKRDCPEVVGLAARWTAEVLLEEFARKQA